VPVGSLALIAVPLYSQPNAWSTVEIMSLFATHALATGAGHYGWMLAARSFPIPALLCAASLPQLAMLPILYVGSDPTLKGALFALAIVHGLGAAAVEPLYIGFNYLDAWAADLSVAATRMAFVEPWRMLTQFVILALLTGTIPDWGLRYAYSGAAPASDGLPVGIQVLLVLISLLTLGLGVLCLWVPISWELRMPTVPCTLHLFPSYTLLVVSDCVAKLGGFLDVLYVTWLLIAGFHPSHICNFFVTTGLVGAAAAVLFCFVFAHLRGFAKICLAVGALATFPPTLIGSVIIVSAPSILDAGGTLFSMLLSLTIVLALIKRMAGSLLKVLSLPARWKYLTLQAHSALALYFLEAASPFIILGLSKAADFPFETSGPYAVSDVFARSSVLLSLPFSILYYLISLATLPALINEGIIPWHRTLTVPESAEALKQRRVSRQSSRKSLGTPRPRTSPTNGGDDAANGTPSNGNGVHFPMLRKVGQLLSRRRPPSRIGDDERMLELQQGADQRALRLSGSTCASRI